MPVFNIFWSAVFSDKADSTTQARKWFRWYIPDYTLQTRKDFRDVVGSTPQTRKDFGDILDSTTQARNDFCNYNLKRWCS